MATSITQFGLKVALSVTKPQLTAKDDKATSDAETANNAHAAGQYRKDLYPKHLIAPILEVESAARAYIAKNTIENVLPSSRILDFAAAMAPFETRFFQAVTVFMQNITNVIAEAQKSQGDMFDQSLYPDTAALRARFTWDIRYDTVSEHGKFAAIMGPMDAASQAHLANSITKQVEREQSALTAEVLTRMHKVVAHLAVATNRPDRVVQRKDGGFDSRPPIFKNSLVDNIKDMAELLEGYAAALPPELLSLKDSAVALAANNVETLKNDPDLRKSTQKAAAMLAAEINQMLGYEDDDIVISQVPVFAPPNPDTPEASPEVQKAAMALVLGDMDEDAFADITIPSPQPAAKAPKEYSTGFDFTELEDF